MTARQMEPWELESLGKAGFGGGIFGAPRQYPRYDMPNGPVGTGAVFGGQFDNAPAQPQQKQRWMDGGKFTGRDALGLALAAIGDAFTGRPNAAGMIAGNFAQRRHAEQQQKLFEQQRAAAREDKMWEWQNKPIEPPKPPAIQQNADYIRATRGDEAANAYLDNYGRGPVQPNVVSIPGLGTFYGTPEEVTAAISAARGSDPVTEEMRRRGLL